MCAQLYQVVAKESTYFIRAHRPREGVIDHSEKTAKCMHGQIPFLGCCAPQPAPDVQVSALADGLRLVRCAPGVCHVRGLWLGPIEGDILACPNLLTADGAV